MLTAVFRLFFLALISLFNLICDSLGCLIISLRFSYPWVKEFAGIYYGLSNMAINSCSI